MADTVVHVYAPPTECQRKGCDRKASRVLVIPGDYEIIEFLALCPEHVAEYHLRLAQQEAAEQAAKAQSDPQAKPRLPN